ncbi:hypothetical protein QCA50_014727 [Cerrena zonata]|uniref:Uncharacterized protein n=1 Tax=Cerrena zonata TaxID=2478898 RepID=A0AAW0FXP6_9APHY
MRSRKERSEQYRLNGVDPQTVLYYDVAKQTLDTRPISTVYGTKNIYRDVRNPNDMDELEKKLSKLENYAAAVIQQVHDCTGETVTLRRKQVCQLRKFMFIMHYRSHPQTYYDPTKIENEETNAWIKELMKREHFVTPQEIWLHILRYYLNTDHYSIVSHGMQAFEKMVMAIIEGNVFRYKIPPDIEHYEAVAYYREADEYYLGFWEAAEGDEFVLTHNSFGLWEGEHPLFGQIHRIFPMGPRIVAVLRTNQHRFDRHNSTFSFVNGHGLLDIPLPPPIAPTFNGAMRTREDLDKHRASPKGLQDIFSMSITKLTATQTSRVNFILLCNVQEAGAVTFLSRPIMLKTLKSFAADCTQKPFFLNNAKKFTPLVEILSSPNEETSSINHPIATSFDDDSHSPSSTIQREHENPVEGNTIDERSAFDHRLVGLFKSGKSQTDPSTVGEHQRSETVFAGGSKSSKKVIPTLDKALDDFFETILVSEDATFPSWYDQARRLWDSYRTTSSSDAHPFARDCDKIISACTSAVERNVTPPPPLFRPRSSARLVTSLDHKSSRSVMKIAVETDVLVLLHTSG